MMKRILAIGFFLALVFLLADHFWPYADAQTRVIGVCGPPGTGTIRSITGTDPAAGAAMIETVPAGVRWRFISMDVTLVTDGNGSPRNVHFFFDDGTNIYLRCTNDQGQAINLTQIYAVANGIHMGFATPNIQSIPCPSVFLPAGHRIREGTNNFQAGDNWGAPQLLVEECPQ